MDEKRPPAEGTVTVEEATEQVKLMARRMAMMYHHIGQVLVERLGQDQAKEILRESIKRYGNECGEMVRQRVLAMGLPLTAENFEKVPDLPKYGWETEWAFDEKGVARPRVTHCPLAAVWLEKGSAELGRLYCGVDQAKYESYGGLSCVHRKNLLDGDGQCLFAIGEKQG
ncbi:MAG TPA: L-2-amino-thiazoline-4-carboxylic acid hydrolase [Bacillota bacterium]|jgi:hypothetical protein